MFIAVQQRAEGDEQSAQAAEVAGAIEAQSPPELEDGVVPAWPHARAGIPGGETLLEKWIATQPKSVERRMWIHAVTLNTQKKPHRSLCLR